MRDVADDYVHIVIDTGGENDEILGSALMVTDELVVPVAPSLIELRRVSAPASSTPCIGSLRCSSPLRRCR